MTDFSEIPAVSVPLSAGREYTIAIGASLRHRAGTLFSEIARSHRAVFITQKAVAEHWLPDIENSLQKADFTTDTLLFPSGERYKTLRTVERLCNGLYNLAPAIDRKTLIVALGGGVVGDVAGFVASLYLRGLDYVQVPTTLLAMVDSSVGGKTGVDFHEGKNLLGHFYQPRAVLIDTEMLSTLPVRERHAGLAEIIKYGVIRDPDLLSLVAIGTQEPYLSQMIRRSCEIKADVVTQDEFERTGLRAILNFGHTIGHALEAITGYKRYKHGEAVAIGMMAASYIGEAAGITPPDVAERIAVALKQYDLPGTLPPDIAPESLLPLLGRDKKAEQGKARFVLARCLGSVELVDGIEDETIRAGLRRISSDTEKI